MITLTPTQLIQAIETYYDLEYKKDMRRAKPQNNYSSATNRMRFLLKALEWLGDIETISGAPMSSVHPYLINCGDMEECILTEVFKRLNGYAHNTNLYKSFGFSDIYGKSAEYEIKYYYSTKYRCTALNRDSKAKFVYLVTTKAVYKIPYQIALESEEVYGNKNPEKYRAICLANIENPEQYIVKSYTAIICG